jgi:tripartite-type tricarboxylate transporter receptor subunit TctC
MAGRARAATYPSESIRWVVPRAPGGGTDILGRLVAPGLEKKFGVSIIVDNRPDAAAVMGATIVTKAKPDGYTFYASDNSFYQNPAILESLPYDTLKDFTAVTMLAQGPVILLVHPDVPAKTLPELIALAKKRPGEIPYATTGVGRLTHLTGELLQYQAGIKLLLVPYSGGPAHAMSDVTTGRVALIIEGYSGIAGAARSGAVKLIAVASAKRLPEFPDVPTVAETIPGFQATGWAVLVAPVGTPEAIIGKVSDDVRKVVAQPELEKKLAALGSYTRAMSAADATSFIHKQQQMWQPVLDEIAKKQK